MAFRLRQNLLRAKSEAENLESFALCCSYFFLICCLAVPLLIFGYYRANVLTHPMLITAFQFLAQSWTGRVGSLHLNECPVSFDYNAITPQITENTLSRLKPSFSNMWKYSQHPVVAFSLAKYFIGCKIRFSKL